MAASGYYLLFCKCDECPADEQIFRGRNVEAAWSSALLRGWRNVGGKVVCPACSGKRRRANSETPMRLVES